MSTIENEIVTGQTNETDYFEVTNGVISLKADYRGDGIADYPASLGNGKKLPLPDVLVIPKQIGDNVVTSLAAGMFYNNKRVKQIVLPEGITEIPAYFCSAAKNLRVINGIGEITKIGGYAFFKTKIKEARFSKLETLCDVAFARCEYLEVANIGSVTVIPKNAFSHCALLREVLWDGTEVKIGANAFYYTRSLRELPLLEHVNEVANSAFFGSRICTDLPKGTQEDLIGDKAFPTFDNTTDFWTDVKFTPCCNRITTKLSQTNPAWKDKIFLNEGSQHRDFFTYEGSCTMFAVMHIHSAITGKHYAHPDEFVQELKDNGHEEFLDYTNWPGQFHNVAPMFEAMGYRTKVYGIASDLSKQDYEDMVDALAQGAYIYTQASEYTYWNEEWNDVNSNGGPNAGHAVVLYGINDLGEVRVLDSSVVYEDFREEGFEQGTDIYTYTVPYQNLVGPSSNFVIVYPTAFTSASRPCGLPTGANVTAITAVAELAQLPEGTVGNLTAYNLFSSPAKAVELWQPNEGNNKYVRYAVDTECWSDWYVVAPASSEPQENAE